MINKILILLVCTFVTPVFIPMKVSAQVHINTNDIALAGRYYQEGEFEKAADLYLKIYETSLQPTYFNIFLNCMVALKDLERAGKEIKKNMRGPGRRPELYVQYGYILKLQGHDKEADGNFRKALEMVGQNKFAYNSLANEFLSRSEYEYAEQVYLQGQRSLPDENFHYELARIYMYQRNYDRMIDEYLALLKINENNLINVQNSIKSALSLDADGSLSELFRNKLLQRMQSDPGSIILNRLLIWFFIQEKRFANALSQQIALDKRTDTEDEFILNLADIAGQNKEYDEALESYDYLLSKGKRPGSRQVVRERMNLYYRRFVDVGKSAKSEANELDKQFRECFAILGYTVESYRLLIDYAHLLAFYLDQTEQASELLNKGLKIPRLNTFQRSEIKTELADVQVYKGDEWEAVLLYTQVAESNRNNALGDEAKLKKAKLSYYMGDFKWAQAQLDVIKASTSKLTSNDAFELSLLISNNLNLDTTDIPMQMFARTDLCLFRNRDSLAIQILDSIKTKYPMHSLRDEILYREATILQKWGNYDAAAGKLKTIIERDSYDLLADDALFMLADIYQFRMNRKEDARNLYKQMLVEHPGSVYVTESRNRYRYLRGDATGQNPESSNGSQD